MRIYVNKYTIKVIIEDIMRVVEGLKDSQSADGAENFDGFQDFDYFDRLKYYL